MRSIASRGIFAVRADEQSRVAEVLGESRSIAIQDGKFEDEFGPYEVHLYRLK